MSVSIHAPARGATAAFPPPRGINPVSIHAPARGATIGNMRSGEAALSFNPRTRAGCDADILYLPDAQLEMASRIPHYFATRNPHLVKGYSSFFAEMRYDSPDRENILA